MYCLICLADVWSHLADLLSNLADVVSHLAYVVSHLANVGSHLADIVSHFSNVGFHLADVVSHLANVEAHFFPFRNVYLGLLVRQQPDSPAYLSSLTVQVRGLQIALKIMCVLLLFLI